MKKNPRSYYRAGANEERRVRKEYESFGWLVLRSAGSKGICDLVCLGTPGLIHLVDIKTTSRLDKKDYARLTEEAEKRGAVAVFVRGGEYVGEEDLSLGS